MRFDRPLAVNDRVLQKDKDARLEIAGVFCMNFTITHQHAAEQAQKKTKYTRTRKSAFYFFGKLYFRRAFRKPFLNGQHEKTEGCEREKESKG